jgi:hypothetical protein
MAQQHEGHYYQDSVWGSPAQQGPITGGRRLGLHYDIVDS